MINALSFRTQGVKKLSDSSEEAELVNFNKGLRIDTTKLYEATVQKPLLQMDRAKTATDGEFSFASSNVHDNPNPWLRVLPRAAP